MSEIKYIERTVRRGKFGHFIPITRTTYLDGIEIIQYDVDPEIVKQMPSVQASWFERLSRKFNPVSESPSCKNR